METGPYPIRSYLLTLLFCLVVSTTLIKAQTDFAPGEIIFTGYNSDDPDAFSFVLLQDVLPSTVIFITDRGWTVANTCAQTILVNDQTPPSITCPSDVTIDNSESTDPQNTGNASGQDNGGGSPGLIYNDVTIEGECDLEHTIQRTWTATDACGNSATWLQIVEVAEGCFVDLSLVKVLNGGQGVVSGGDDVDFTITVINDGNVKVGLIKVIDYIPTGFTLNDPAGTAGTTGSTGHIL